MDEIIYEESYDRFKHVLFKKRATATMQIYVGKVQFSQPPDKIVSGLLPVRNIRRRTATGRFDSLCKFYPARFYQSFTAYLH